MRKGKVFMKYFGYFCLFLVLPLLLNVSVYVRTMDQLTTNAAEQNYRILEAGILRVQRYLGSIDDTISILSQDEDLGAFLTMQPFANNSKNAHVAYRAVQRVKKSVGLSSNGTEFVFYSRTSGMLINRQSAYQSLDEFANIRFSYADMTTDEWKENLLYKVHYKELLPAVEVVMAGSKNRALTYITSYPLTISKEKRGAIFAIIPEATFLMHFLEEPSPEDQMIAIYNTNGQCLASSNPAVNLLALLDDQEKGSGSSFETINGTEYLISHTLAGTAGWVCAYAVPKAWVLHSVRGMLGLIYTVLGISLLVGGFMAFLLSRKVSNGFISVITEGQKLAPEDLDFSGNEFRYMSQIMSTIERRQENLESLLAKKTTEQKEAFITGLLRNRYFTREEAFRGAEAAEFSLHLHKYAIILLSLSHKEEGAAPIPSIILQTQLQMLLEPYLRNISIFCALDDETCVLLAGCIHDDEAETRRLLSEAFEVARRGMLQESQTFLRGAVGRYYADVLNMDQSYFEAAQILDTSVLDTNNALVWFDDQQKESMLSEIYYPIELEQSLIDCIRNGNASAAERIVQSVYEENAVNRSLSYDKIQVIISMLYNTVSRCGYDMVGKCADKSSLFKASEQIAGIIREICEKTQSEKTTKSNRLMETVDAYIEKHFSDPDISLYDVASKFGISPMHLSSSFKTFAGENFVKKVARLRITKAGLLLKNTDTGIAEIAVAVGYNDVRTFRDAFKKIFAVTPKEYREHAMKQG